MATFLRKIFLGQTSEMSYRPISESKQESEIYFDPNVDDENHDKWFFNHPL